MNQRVTDAAEAVLGYFKTVATTFFFFEWFWRFNDKFDYIYIHANVLII